MVGAEGPGRPARSAMSAGSLESQEGRQLSDNGRPAETLKVEPALPQLGKGATIELANRSWPELPHAAPLPFIRCWPPGRRRAFSSPPVPSYIITTRPHLDPTSDPTPPTFNRRAVPQCHGGLTVLFTPIYIRD